MNQLFCQTVLIGTLSLQHFAFAGNINSIENLVVIYAENHSFDNLFGLFPGAEGIHQATSSQKLQLDHDGKPLKELKVFEIYEGNFDQFCSRKSKSKGQTRRC